MSVTSWPHIEINERGRPIIRGTRYKALALVQEHQAFAWDAEQLQRQHPDLTLPQIHAVLGYYYEHKSECDQILELDHARTGTLLNELINPELQQRLQRLKEGA